MLFKHFPNFIQQNPNLKRRLYNFFFLFGSDDNSWIFTEVYICLIWPFEKDFSHSCWIELDYIIVPFLCKMSHSILPLNGSRHRTIQAKRQNDMTVVFRERAMVVITALQRSSGTAYVTVDNQSVWRQPETLKMLCTILPCFTSE